MKRLLGRILRWVKVGGLHQGQQPDEGAALGFAGRTEFGQGLGNFQKVFGEVQPGGRPGDLERVVIKRVPCSKVEFDKMVEQGAVVIPWTRLEAAVHRLEGKRSQTLGLGLKGNLISGGGK